jgi:hypothetical protein
MTGIPLLTASVTATSIHIIKKKCGKLENDLSAKRGKTVV